MIKVKEIISKRNIFILPKSLRHGFAQMPRPVLRYPGLSLNSKATYCLLLSYAWQDNFCFPGQDKMAQELGITGRSVRKYLAELKKHKLIDWKKRGYSKTNNYYILSVPDVIIKAYEKNHQSGTYVPH